MERGRSQDHVARAGVRSWNEEGVRVVESGMSQGHRKRRGVRIIESGNGSGSYIKGIG